MGALHTLRQQNVQFHQNLSQILSTHEEQGVIEIINTHLRECDDAGLLAEVELAGDVGGRDDHHEHLLGRHILQTVLAAILGLEESLLLPPGVPSSL